MNYGHWTLTKALASVSKGLLTALPPLGAIAIFTVVTGTGAGSTAQQPPPIHGVTGTIATEGTIQESYQGANKILVKTSDGIEHLFHVNRRSTVHNGDAADGEALRGLKKGTPVVVHYTTAGEELTAEEIDRLGDEGLKQMEGTVVAVKRGDRTISIKLADGAQETLRLSERAAADVGKDIDRAGDNAARVIVYYRDEAGQRVAHFFKRVS